ncbi:hypothetical protein [Neorhizobium alkalisoli]|uniref:hypothetical protein n=1 Tax=Neorhizobium alkalisoli TaxID=528178 RepID=UPI001319E248|nr:hypothetical protein [Neorhizobium alkalisoli]
MRSYLDGQSRKTDRFIEQSFKRLNSTWATGVFAGSNLIARRESKSLSAQGISTSIDVGARRSHDFQRARIFAGNCAWFLHCDLRCIQMTKKGERAFGI